MWFQFHFDSLNTFLLISLVVWPSECEADKETCDMTCEKQNTAVVLYDENLLSPFMKQSRSFTFVSREIVVKQDWGQLGVAAVVWDAAIVLCEFIEKNKEEFNKKNVIELGAGSGLVGIVAALIGADTVITDRQTVYPYLKRVVKENLRDVDNINYSVKVLDWTKDLHRFDQKYDFILGADIIYVEEIFDDLLKTLLHLSHNETKLYISCKIRYDRDTNFLDMLKKHFDLKEISYDRERDIKVIIGTKIK